MNTETGRYLTPVEQGTVLKACQAEGRNIA